MTREDFYNLANGQLRVIETTSGYNGYPQDLMPAIIGFETYEEACVLATANDLAVINIHRRDGWQLWERKGLAMDAIHLYAEDIMDEYYIRSYTDTEEFIDDLKNLIEDIDDFEQIESLVRVGRKVIDSLSTIDPDEEQVITNFSTKVITMPQKTMSYEHDSHYHAIAIINRNF